METGSTSRAPCQTGEVTVIEEEVMKEANRVATGYAWRWQWDPHGSGKLFPRLAQSVEHETLNLRVVGSSPTLGANVKIKHSHNRTSGSVVSSRRQGKRISEVR